jgi:glycosyltransferase involved in cell wall biosynthesis
MPHLSLVIPVYNERAPIEEIIRRVRDVDIDKEILIIDDGSTDGTREFLTDLAEHSSLEPATPTLLGSRALYTRMTFRSSFKTETAVRAPRCVAGFKKPEVRL